MASALRLSSYARAGTRNQLVILIARERDKERTKKKKKKNRAICVISRRDKKYR